MLRTNSAFALGMLMLGGSAMFAQLPALAKGGPPRNQVVGPLAPQSMLKDGKLIEFASSSFSPLMETWIEKYQKLHTDIHFSAQTAESAFAISQVGNGNAHIGVSEAYMSDSQLADGKLLNIPLVVGAEQIVYNVPELGSEHLRLSGQALVGIYNGSIQFWDDAKLKALNQLLSKKLPHQQIVPIHEAGGSGDTFVFSQYLESSDVSWRAGSGMKLTWPSVPGALNVGENQAAVSMCAGRAYSIAYTGLSSLEQTQRSNLGMAALKNREGKFVLPTGKSISSAAWTFDHETPADERVSLVGAPGDDAYPIVTYEYAIVNPHQPDEATAEAIKHFLSWAIAGSGGSDAQYLRRHFAPLPSDITKLSQKQIDQIKGS